MIHNCNLQDDIKIVFVIYLFIYQVDRSCDWLMR
jgi:hypothetical protein